MNFYQTQAYNGFLLGTSLMICTHNLFTSLCLYISHQTIMSNFFKVIFNLGNILQFGATLGVLTTPSVVTLPLCQALLYVATIGNVAKRLSLAAFLLWRLNQINRINKLDSWACIILFTARVALGIVQFATQRIGTLYSPELDLMICASLNNSLILPTITMALEFIIDAHVTFRLIQILGNANKNSALIPRTNKNKRTLFTAVMYWNFLRLFIAVTFHIAPLLNLFLKDATATTLSILTAIILSYVITIDAEIVHVIEGKDEMKNSPDLDYSIFQSHIPREHYGEPPEYSQCAQNTSDKQEDYNQIDEDKIAIVSMKKLSFYEWAIFIIGDSLHRNNDDERL